MNNLVVTSGNKYIDIDAYAGCIAYAKLLNNIGYSSISITTSKYNGSISSVIKKLSYKLDDYNPDENDEYIILDVSNPNMFDNVVNLDKVIEVIDHHTGFEGYWSEKKIKTKIEFIGSICTIIFERYKEYDKLELLDRDLCKLLIAGILDNTLNLKAAITTKRDEIAYNELLKIGNIEDNWASEYFLSCQKEIENNLEETIVNDIKIENFGELLPNIFGQLLTFDKYPIIRKIDLIKNIFNKYEQEWMFNLISLKDGKSYIIAEPIELRRKLELFFNKKFEDNILILDKFMLRKEIIKKARNN
jgi:inorganic pyrophosphatase/exopolyphosphatase